MLDEVKCNVDSEWNPASGKVQFRHRFKVEAPHLRKLFLLVHLSLRSITFSVVIP